MKHTTIAIAMFSLLAGTAYGQVALDGDFVKDPDKLHIAVSPYLWFAGIDGTLAVGPYQANFQQSFRDILSNFKFGLMGLTEVRKGRIVLLSDLFWTRIGNSKAVGGGDIPQSSQADAHQDTFFWDNEIGYRAVATDRFNLDALIGLRYWHMDTGINFSPGIVRPDGTLIDHVYGATNFVDPIMGLRVQAKIYKSLGAFAKADIGGYGMGSNLTGQVIAGFGIPVKKIGLDFGYRRLYVDRERNQQVYNITFQGLFLGATFGLK